MACNVNLKTLGGEYVKTATLAKWHKGVGDKVNKGDTIVSAETAKVTVDIVAPESGIITKIFYNEGDDVDINETIAVIDESGIMISDEPVKKENNQENEKFQLVKSVAENECKRIFISPVAKLIAKENNIDINEIEGKGPNGRIVKEDVLKFIKDKEVKVTEKFEKSNKIPVQAIKLLGRRKGIAQKMSSSSTNIPHVTIMMDVEIEKLKEIRTAMNSSSNEAKLSLTDFIMYLTVKALKKYPMLNAHFTNNEIKVYSNINLGVAVDLDEGLLVPVVKNCEKKSLFEISTELKQLAEKAKQGKIAPNEVTEGTFTITNLGNYGVKYFTPIINEPEVAILGIGKIERHEKEVLPLSLSFDHRIIDGAPAARFLNGLKEILENPYLVLFN